jgi:hypothetical protein
MSTTDFKAPRFEADRLYHCHGCKDDPSAWRLCWCPGYGDLKVAEFGVPGRFEDMARTMCARVKAHGPHPFAERCACFDTNPAVLAARARQREEAEKRAARSKARRDG